MTVTVANPTHLGFHGRILEGETRLEGESTLFLFMHPKNRAKTLEIKTLQGPMYITPVEGHFALQWLEES